MDCQAYAQSVAASVSDDHASDAIQLAAPLACDAPVCESRVTGDSHPSAANNEDSDAIQLAAPMVWEVSDSEPEVTEVSAISLVATSASQPSASSSFAHMLASPRKKVKIERLGEVTGAGELMRKDSAVDASVVVGASQPNISEPSASSSTRSPPRTTSVSDAPQLAASTTSARKGVISDEVPACYRDVFNVVFSNTASASQPSASSREHPPPLEEAPHLLDETPVWHPDVPSVVQEILELGRFPSRHKNPSNDAEVRENRLARDVNKHRENSCGLVGQAPEAQTKDGSRNSQKASRGKGSCQGAQASRTYETSEAAWPLS